MLLDESSDGIVGYLGNRVPGQVIIPTLRGTWILGHKNVKSVNIWQSYKQERDCLVHFIRLLAVCWPGVQSAWDNHAVACNFVKYSLIFFHSYTQQ